MPDNLFSRWLERGVDALVLLSGWWLIAFSLTSCFEMVSRKLFAFSLQGVDEVGGYTLAVTSAIGFSYTLITRGHTRVDFLLSKLPGGLRSFLNWFAMTTLSAMALFGMYRASNVLSESIEFQSTATTPLQTPLWLPQGIWFVGYGLFALISLYLAAHATLLLLRGRRAELDRAYGPQTLDEEIQAEAGEVMRDVKQGSAR
ncbi:MAG: TRAP transporter small permease [Burkholderiales bacterium]|nr:TRAP transporter small permease [Burkholderiales bacterium]